MGRKKNRFFIDKKNSATFQLLARDSSSAAADDRVFVRVDNNRHVSVDDNLFFEGNDWNNPHGDPDPDSIFADAPEDDDVIENDALPWIIDGNSSASGIPEHVRKEILELGFPDDGYNYLVHLREISKGGGGSAYFHNPKARLDRVPHDVKAYDASRLKISEDASDNEDGRSEKLMYAVASKTVGVKLQKAVDLDVLRLLEYDDLSKFGSDVEDLDEDFVVKANLPEDGEEVIAEEDNIQVFGGHRKSDGTRGLISVTDASRMGEEDEVHYECHAAVGDNPQVDEKPRVRRVLDEDFDMLTLREYENGSDDDVDDYSDNDAEFVAAKLKDVVKDYAMDDLDRNDTYRVPADLLHENPNSNMDVDLGFSADIIHKCQEYAKRYCEDEDIKELILVQETSSESEIWDCETIVSTFSNLDNHPGKIQAPGGPRRKVLKPPLEDLKSKAAVIELRGKEKLPVDFLPQHKRTIEKVKKEVSSGAPNLKRRSHGQESKKEKKERKAAVKEERREARRAKKELKGLYRCETQKAQKVAAVTGPSSIHLM